MRKALRSPIAYVLLAGVTAYHEAGHVIVGHVLPHADPIHKVSIVARSRSLGLTFTLPEDKHNHSRSELRDVMAMCLGGRTELGHQANYTEEVAASIDTEVRHLIDDAHHRARAILTLHREILDRLAAALVEAETLDTPELMAIIGPLRPTPAAPPPTARPPTVLAATATASGRLLRDRDEPT